MLTTALLLMLTATGDGPRSARLVSDVPPPPMAEEWKSWSEKQLRDEYDRLAATRPGIGGSIGLMATGGGVFLTAAYIFLLAGGLGGGSAAVPFLILLGVASTAAAALIVIGIIVLTRNLPERKAIGAQMDALQELADKRQAQFDRDRPPPPRDAEEAPYVPEEPEYIGPPPVGPPPLPLPPMPESFAPTVPIYLARF